MFKSNYIAKKPNHRGYVNYSEAENKIWQRLYQRQINIVTKYACNEYLKGLQILNMPSNRIPQIYEMNAKLSQATGWQVEAVPALIPHARFFNLLANKTFPAATFIRSEKQLDYITEPDIFHEYFGHCPMLTFQPFANFMQRFGQLASRHSAAQQNQLASLYWFTVEFGLIETPTGIKIYGGGILSSPEETIYAIESPLPKRLPLVPQKVLNTEFKIDIKQSKYFVIKSFDELFSMMDNQLRFIVG